MLWILIHVGSVSRQAKPTHKIAKSKEMSCFRKLDDLFVGLWASFVAWKSFVEA
jgi:hypothetical protein